MNLKNKSRTNTGITGNRHMELLGMMITSKMSPGEDRLETVASKCPVCKGSTSGQGSQICCAWSDNMGVTKNAITCELAHEAFNIQPGEWKEQHGGYWKANTSFGFRRSNTNKVRILDSHMYHLLAKHCKDNGYESRTRGPRHSDQLVLPSVQEMKVEASKPGHVQKSHKGHIHFIENVLSVTPLCPKNKMCKLCLNPFIGHDITNCPSICQEIKPIS